MNVWLVMLIAGLLTFGMRLSFIYLLGHAEVPELVRRALRFVPPAVLAALTVPALIMPQGQIDLSFANHRWPAGLVAIAAAALTKSILLSIVAGMAALLVLQLLF